jgi:mannan endo-1,4-beta-mannosidase
MGGARQLRHATGAVLASVLLLVSGASAGAVPSVPTPGVGVSGTSLTLNGRPWWPIGINAYQLGTDWNVNAGCGAQVDLDDYFGGLQPHSLTRFNVYATLAVNKNTGALDFSALDAVFDAAWRHQQLLVGVLTPQDGACENGYVKDYDWYAGGWRSAVSHGLPMSYADWVRTAVGRWAGSPALAGWAAVGEPEPSDCGEQQCTWQSRACRDHAAEVLRTFLDDTGALIRWADPDAVVFSGQAGGGQCGSAGDEFALVAASPGVDVLEYHYYTSSDSLPGSAADGLARRVDQARAVGKPLLVAEVGMEAGSCLPVAQRERTLKATVDAQRAHGTAGAMFWSYVPDPRNDQCTLDIGPDDPLVDLVGAG